MAEEPADDPSLWTVELQKVVRITPADPEDEVGVLFAVTFEAEGPNLTASVEAMVCDVADEGQVIAEAMDAVKDGLEQWAAVLGSRPGAAAVEPEGE